MYYAQSTIQSRTFIYLAWGIPGDSPQAVGAGKGGKMLARPTGPSAGGQSSLDP